MVKCHQAHSKLRLTDTLRRPGIALIVVVLFAIGPQSIANDAVGPSSNRLEDRVEAAIREEELVGAVWALVTPDETILGAAGKSDARTGTPMTSANRVHVGSVAKALVALGILRLVTDGRVDLDAPLARYLHDVPVHNRWEREAPLTVRHLLDHTGGLSDARLWQVFSVKAEPDQSLRASLALTDRPIRVRYRPGDRTAYSNVGYVLLAMVIEQVTGDRYEAWLAREILDPLGMSASTFFFVSQDGSRRDVGLAMGHLDPATPIASKPMHLRASGQFTSTAADMSKLARFLMSDGSVGGRVLIDRCLLQQMGVPRVTEAARAGLRVGYALGLMRRDRHGAIGKCHLGNLGTFRSALCVYPEHAKAFFIAYNSDPEAAHFDRVDGLIAGALDVRSSAATPKGEALEELKRWAGFYRLNPNRFEQFAYLDEVFGVTSVSHHDGGLKLSPLQGSARSLRPAGGALFRTEDRIEASHVLIEAQDGRLAISDGIRTLEKVSPLSVYAHWLSAALGIAALCYTLAAGGWRSLIASRGKWLSDPMSLPALALLALAFVPALYLMQPESGIGDLAPATVAMAMLSGALPLALVFGAAMRLRAGLDSAAAKRDFLVLCAALQWCVVLISWEMLPFISWM